MGIVGYNHAANSAPENEGLLRILVPFHRDEGMTVENAAKAAGVHCSTMRLWCATRGLGRRIGRRAWTVSRVALQMYLEGNSVALRAYHAGDRTGEAVAGYYRRLGLGHLPKMFGANFIANSANSACSDVGV